MLNLTRREADIAVRPTRRPPETLAGRRIASLASAVYGAAGTAAEDPHHPQQRWVAWEEARRIRALGLAQPILVLSGFDSPADLDQLRELDADSLVHHAAPLARVAQAHGAPTRHGPKTH